MVPFSLILLSFVAGAYSFSVPSSTSDYAPVTNVQCPNVSIAPLIRQFSPQTQALHPSEEAYVSTRLSTVVPNAWTTWVGDASALGYNISDFNNSFANIGVAVSGGSYRAAQYGAGVFSALDGRNDSARAAGTGGLAQVASYFSGLSGASTSIVY